MDMFQGRQSLYRAVKKIVNEVDEPNSREIQRLGYQESRQLRAKKQHQNSPSIALRSSTDFDEVDPPLSQNMEEYEQESGNESSSNSDQVSEGESDLSIELESVEDDSNTDREQIYDGQDLCDQFNEVLGREEAYQNQEDQEAEERWRWDNEKWRPGNPKAATYLFKKRLIYSVLKEMIGADPHLTLEQRIFSALDIVQTKISRARSISKFEKSLPKGPPNAELCKILNQTS
ncbi:hypothetical protein BGZ76_002236 [Entomortierella beljakovae]|nr:hypothetical protein BGZ76_002236 [Entomortierella beljakovae]